MSHTQFHYQWRDGRAIQRFRSAVSLHSHTLHSHESLDFIPRFAQAIPLVREAVNAQERRYERKNGRALDYDSAYWTPPLSERDAVQLERSQIHSSLDLAALVSLTDHDNIDAASHLHMFEEHRDAPISVEWTVPYGPTFFHLGIHNLPTGNSRAWMGRLAEFTAAPQSNELRSLLSDLSATQDVLIVFNHPLWDEKAIGAQLHRDLALEFLNNYGKWLHALELNGMRPWSENQAAATLADSVGLPFLSGGDRHGAEPNAVLNLTNRSSFPEFIDEIRRGRRSEILLLSQYREPHRQRYFETICDVMRDYPESPGRVRWTDRFYFRTAQGLDAKLSTVWAGDGPGICSAFLSLVRLMRSPQMKSTMRYAMRDKSEALP